MCIACCIIHVLHLHSKQTLVIKTISTVYQCMACRNSLWASLHITTYCTSFLQWTISAGEGDGWPPS